MSVRRLPAALRHGRRLVREGVAVLTGSWPSGWPRSGRGETWTSTATGRRTSRRKHSSRSPTTRASCSAGPRPTRLSSGSAAECRAVSRPTFTTGASTTGRRVSPNRPSSSSQGRSKRFFENQVRGIAIDGFGESFGLDGLTYYAYGRMVRRPGPSLGPPKASRTSSARPPSARLVGR